jgi:ROS/MUCR transcriptional regulator protein
VMPDYIVSLEDGRKLKTLKRYLVDREVSRLRDYETVRAAELVRASSQIKACKSSASQRRSRLKL